MLTTLYRWVEETMKNSESFNAPSIHKNDDSRKDRLRYWNNELCHKRPHTFDIVIAVSLARPLLLNHTNISSSVVTELYFTLPLFSNESFLRSFLLL